MSENQNLLSQEQQLPWKVQESPKPNSNKRLSTMSDNQDLLSQEEHIPNSQNGQYGSMGGTNASAPPSSGTMEMWPFILINLIVILMGASGYFHDPLVDQYLYQHFSKSLFVNATEKTTSHPCLNESLSNSSANIHKVQKLTSELLLNLNLLNYGIGLFACLLLGAKANSMSRRALLFIPVFGYLFKCVMIAIVVWASLDNRWLYLGYVVEGCCGNNWLETLIVSEYTQLLFRFGGLKNPVHLTAGNRNLWSPQFSFRVQLVTLTTLVFISGLFMVTFDFSAVTELCGLFLGAFLYTSDITPSDSKRTLGLAAAEGLKGVIGACLSVVTGQLMQRSGFIIPAVVSAGCVVVSMFLVFILPDRRPRINIAEAKWWNQLTLPFNRQQNSRVRKMVAVGCIAFVLVEIAGVGTEKLRNLYLMNLPLCFDAITIGWFMFARKLSYNAVLMLSIHILYPCLPGMGLGILGAFSSFAGYIMFALATTETEIYSIAVLSVAQSLPLCIIRGETSRLLGPEAQGPWFAILSVLESIGYFLGTPALSVYRSTLDFYRGLIFLLFSGDTIVVIVLLIIYHKIWRRYSQDKEEEIRSTQTING